MSLTSDFLANHVAFMRDQAILIPAQIPAGNGKFQFVPQGAHAALLQRTDQTTNIPGYYAHAVANNDNIYILPTQQPNKYYMLTDAMNGCQFLAYGPNRQHVTVEHNNYIGNNANYAARLQTIAGQNHAYFFHISAEGNNIPNGLYNAQQGINIVGEYTTANGWRFWVRDRIDLNNGTVFGPF
ncbi:hypothetical protein ABRQ01_10675 [Pectobacterium aroidearum]|uniref:hypothetical protein n=1 Tax=Pectobacterium aroidearum TaxID=1201031 RepID=UPI0032EECC8A